MENQVWWYKYTNQDDFEYNNVINEIDAHFKFDTIQDVLDNKKTNYK